MKCGKLNFFFTWDQGKLLCNEVRRVSHDLYAMAGENNSQRDERPTINRIPSGIAISILKFYKYKNLNITFILDQRIAYKIKLQEEEEVL